MKKPRYSDEQVSILDNAIRDAAKRCRENSNKGSRVTIRKTIIDLVGWPQTVIASGPDHARILFQEPPGTYERSVVLLIDSGSIGILTHAYGGGKEQEYMPFDARAICTYLERMTDSARQALSRGTDIPDDMFQFHIDALTALE